MEAEALLTAYRQHQFALFFRYMGKNKADPLVQPDLRVSTCLCNTYMDAESYLFWLSRAVAGCIGGCATNREIDDTC